MEVAIFLGVVALVVGVYLVNAHYDKRRIMEAGLKRGWRDIEITWTFFAPGALSDGGMRNYLVTYSDGNGERRSKYCKTSGMAGVYWADDDETPR